MPLKSVFGTSKLIIPPKPARNSPYIPKVRIRLGPPVQRGEFNKPEDSNGVPDGKVCDNSTGDYMGSVCSFELDTATTVSSLDLTESSHKKPTPKRRKSSISPDVIDLEDAESVLTKINLKSIINRDTFYALPTSTQRMLADFLPIFDRKRTFCAYSESPTNSFNVSANGSDSPTIDSKSEPVWLHSSALNNEFFNKALQDYTTRQANGEFTPRVRNRAGLRTSVGNRPRYTSSSTLTPKSLQDKRSPTDSLRSSPGQSNRIRSTYNSKVHSLPPTSPNSSQSDYKWANHKPQPQSSTEPSSDNSSIQVHGEQSIAKNRPSRKSRRASLRSSLECDANLSLAMSQSSLLSSSNESLVSATVEADNDPACSALSSVIKPISEASQVSLHPTVDLVNRQSSDGSPHRDETMFTDQALEPPDATSNVHDEPANTVSSFDIASCLSPTGPIKIAGTLETIIQCEQTVVDGVSNVLSGSETTAVERKSASFHSRQSRISKSENLSTGPSPMPPPRQTKTLASMREKLRAKRLLKESQRPLPSPRCYSLPGSVTPHPACGSNGYFHLTPTPYLSHGCFGSSLDTPNGSPNTSSYIHNTCSTSPSLNDQESGVNTHVNLDNPTGFHVFKSISNSPVSPRSLPAIDCASPTSGSSSCVEGLTNTVGASINPTLCPSSPHSTSMSLYGNSEPFYPLDSADVMHDFHQVHSTSAPPTPQISQSEQALSACFDNATPIVSTPKYHGRYTDSLSGGMFVTSVVNCESNAVSVTSSVCRQFPDSDRLVGTSTAKQCVTLVSQANANEVSSSCDSSSVVGKIHTSGSCPSFSSTVTPVCAAVSSLPVSIGNTSVTSDTHSHGSPHTSPLVSKLLVGASPSNRSSTTTRAFFVDGNNLSEAVARFQSMNPKATVTQQQFLLIPGPNKEMFLCRVPVTTSSELSVPSESPKCNSSSGINVINSVPSSSVSLLKPEPGPSIPTPAPSKQICSKQFTLALEESGVNSVSRPISDTVAVRSPVLPSVQPRSLVCSKSLVLPSPSFVPLKPSIKAAQSPDITCATGFKRTSLPKLAPAEQPQIAISLLPQNSPVIRPKTSPVVLLSDRVNQPQRYVQQPHPPPNHLGLSSVSSGLLDECVHLAYSSQPTVISPLLSSSSCDQRRRPQCSVAPSHTTSFYTTNMSSGVFTNNPPSTADHQSVLQTIVCPSPISLNGSSQIALLPTSIVSHGVPLPHTHSVPKSNHTLLNEPGDRRDNIFFRSLP